MEEKLLRHYRLELDFLRQLGVEFAAAYPGIAGHLGMPYQSGMDPHVERLREGFALLSARIRAKIEDEQPELTEALLGVLYPQLTQPIPSMSVVRFKIGTDHAALTKGVVLEAGAVLKSDRTGNEPSCEFRTAYPVNLWPLSVGPIDLSQQVDIDDARGTGAIAVLTVPLRCAGMIKLGQLDPHKFRSIRFYLGGEGYSPFLLRDRLIHDVVRIELREQSKGPDCKRIVLAGSETQARRIVRPVGFADDEGVLPRPERALLGHANLREFFAFPQKYLFVDVERVDGVVQWGQATGFDIKLYLKRLPSGGVIRPENMQLFCTPIINLFPRTCRVIRDNMRVEYAVEAPEAREAAARDFFEVFSIDSVRPFDSAGSSNREYQRYDDLRTRSSDGKRTFWYARRRAVPGADTKRTVILLSFVDERNQIGPPEDPSITVQATCTNLDLPVRLPSLTLRLERTAPYGGVELVGPLTRAQAPPSSREYHWRLISQLAINHLPIGDPLPTSGKPRTPGRGTEVLREILRLSDPLGTDISRRQIEAIRHVGSRHEFRSLPHDRRAVVGGVGVTIDFGEDTIAQSGLLLAEILDQFLAHYVSINAFSRLTAIVGEKKVREWEPRSGEKILL